MKLGALPIQPATARLIMSTAWDSGIPAYGPFHQSMMLPIALASRAGYLVAVWVQRSQRHELVYLVSETGREAMVNEGVLTGGEKLAPNVIHESARQASA